MNQVRFLEVLSSVKQFYNWTYVDNTLIGEGRRGKYKGVQFNPVTAVASCLHLGYFPNTKAGTIRAAKAVGVTKELAGAIYSASNRGHAQIIRGRMLDVLL